MIYPNFMDHFQPWAQKIYFTPNEYFGPNASSASLDYISQQSIPASGPVCCGCGAVALTHKTIPLFEGQVLPPTWDGDWTRAAVCAVCYARQQALLHPVTLMAFRHMRKDAT